MADSPDDANAAPPKRARKPRTTAAAKAPTPARKAASTPKPPAAKRPAKAAAKPASKRKPAAKPKPATAATTARSLAKKAADGLPTSKSGIAAAVGAAALGIAGALAATVGKEATLRAAGAVRQRVAKRRDDRGDEEPA